MNYLILQIKVMKIRKKHHKFHIENHHLYINNKNI